MDPFDHIPIDVNQSDAKNVAIRVLLYKVEQI